MLPSVRMTATGVVNQLLTVMPLVSQIQVMSLK